MLLFIAATAAARGEDADAAQQLKLAIWQRGMEPCGSAGCSLDESLDELLPRWSQSRQRPVLRLRGGGDSGCAGASCEPPTRSMDSLLAELGPEFAAALEQNERDHEALARTTQTALAQTTLAKDGTRTGGTRRHSHRRHTHRLRRMLRAQREPSVETTWLHCGREQ